MMKKLVTIFFVSTLVFGVSAEAEEKAWNQRPIEVIDVPTADPVDHYGYHVTFRFGRDGALQTKTAFGVFPRLNIGFGLDGERVLGTEDGRLNKPTINVKFRLFDGKGALPAIAAGFDGQGYIFNKALDEYEQREKGFYIVGTSEILFPNFLLTVGGNIFDFDEGNAVRAFTGMTYTYEQIISALFEYDHATEYKERRINYGLRYFITPLFTVDAVARNVPGLFSNVGGVLRQGKRKTERIVKLNYTGSF